METVKICFILPEAFPVPAVCGGAIETLITSLVEQNIKNSKYEFTICSVYHEQAVEAYEKIKSDSVKMFWTYPETAKSKIKHFVFRIIRKTLKIKIWKLCKHYGEVARFLSKEKFNLIIAEGGNFEAKGEIAKKYKKEQLVIHVHNHYIPEQIVSQRYGAVIGVSEFVTKEYKKNCSKEVKGYTLKNAIDVGKFSQKVSVEEMADLKAKLGFEEDDFIVLYVGRIIDVKGVKELIESVIGIADSCVKLLIVGSPNFSAKSTSLYLDEIQSLTEQHPERIIYTGYIKNDQIYKYAAIADVQCVPSLWEEAAGLVVLEAMASGLPTIVTNSGGMVEYVTNETSIIVNRGEQLVNGLQDAILYLKQNINVRKRMEKASKEHVKQYDEAQYYDNFIRIVQNIIGDQK